MATRRTVLVTGASGFLGTHLARALRARGDRVRAAYRRPEPPREIAALASDDFELFRVDLQDAERVAGLVDGIDAVIHAAALTSDWGPYDRFRVQNYDATVALLEAARNAGAREFVYVSSAVVNGFGVHVDSTEEGPYYPLRHPYQKTKRLAEDHVLAHDGPGFRTVAVRPGNVYGPGDHTSTYPMFTAILDGVFGYLGSGRAYTCPLYIDDLVAGVLAALDRQEVRGEPILLTDGEKVPWKDYVEAMYDAVGSNRRPLRLPTPLAWAAAVAMTTAARVARARTAPALTLYRVEQASRHYHFSNEKAQRLLDFQPRVFFREGLGLTAEAFLAERTRRTAGTDP
ncbi:MAG: NAD-dependent epimerase/dehydratase family protein [Deltaproteobacteria bacterium]|nr:NAD-dependent epimerase/dehydratase family protein [Deltaproteobacteria bacterium]